MKKKLWMYVMILSLGVILIGCGDEDMHDMDDTDELATLEVDLQVADTVEVDEKLELKAVVTYGDEAVTDADEVEYEVWEEGQEDNSMKIDAVNNEDGSYTAETSFDKDGLFHVQVHVTAKDLHTMPTQEVTVGEGGHNSDAEEGNSDHESHEEDTDSHDEDEDHHHHHGNGFEMNFSNLEDVSMNEEISLNVLLEMDNDALTDAEVQYEIWNDDLDNSKHEWVEAEETNPGEYVAEHTFEHKGLYTIQIHVQNEEGLHEHEQHEVEVN
ncbi:FixH family protein [Ornithinibacillus salinisoli]|uniref:FixH family protein n=1 Tax=Ornithinibacillus salinisoli TaxID=1848459 RepID=A0ABW4VYY7_9BACI